MNKNQPIDTNSSEPTVVLRSGKYWELLTQPHEAIRNSEHQGRARILSAILISLVFAGGIAIFLEILKPTGPHILIQCGWGTLAILFTYALSRTRYYRVAAICAVAVVSTLTFSTAILSRDPEVLSFLILSIVLSSLFVSPRSMLLILAAHILAIVLLPGASAAFSYSTTLTRAAFLIGVTGLLATVASSIQWQDNLLIEQQSRVLASDLEELRSKQESLHLNEARLQLQFERMPFGCILWDGRFQVTAWNPAAEHIFGYSAEEAVGKSPFDLIIPNHVRLDLEQTWERLIHRVGTEHIINENLTKDGQIILCEWSDTPLLDTHGNFVGVLSMVEDITTRVAAENARRLSEENYRRLFENALLGIFQAAPDGKIIDVNPAAVQMFGYQSKEEVLATIHNVRTDVYANPDQRQQITQQLAGDHERKAVEVEFRRKDGSPFSANLHIRAVRDPNGKPVYFDGIIEDITERKQAEAALLRSEGRYRALFEESPVALWELNLSGLHSFLASLRSMGISDLAGHLAAHPETMVACIQGVEQTDANRAALLLAGTEKKEDILGTAKVFDRQTLGDYRNLVIGLATGGSQYDMETVIQRVDGGKLDVSLNWSVTVEEEGRAVRALVSIMDITARKNAEKALHRKLAELEAINRITAALRYAKTLQKLVETMLNETLSVFNCPSGLVILPDREGQAPPTLISRGWRSEVSPDAVSSKWINAMLSRDEPYWIDDFFTDAAFKRAIRIQYSAGWGGIALPLQDPSEPIGILLIVFEQSRHLSESEVQLLKTIAEMGSVAIQRTRLTERLSHSHQA